MEKKLVLIDGNSIINRAFYAIPILTNSNGEYCNAVYGFCNILVKIILDEKPDYMAICFDAAKKTFRNEIFKEYKGTRKPMPFELAEQFPALKKVLKAMNIFIIEKVGFEADDLIGTLSKKFDVKTIIFSGDRDLLQLIDDKTEVHLTKKGVTDIQMFNEKTLKEIMNITPKQVIELKALMGDKSDNIPGVPGVGEKTANTLIQDYDNVENLYSHLMEINGKLYEKLLNGKDICFMSKTLATINTKVDVDVNIEDLTYDFPFNNNVFELFKYYEFNSLIKRPNIFEVKKDDEFIKHNENKKIIIEDNNLLNKVVSNLKNETIFALYIDDDVHLSTKNNEEYIIKCNNKDLLIGLNLGEVLKTLKPILEDDNNKKICFDIKKIKHILYNFDIKLNGKCFDISLANYLLNGSKKGSTEIETFMAKYGYENDNKASLLINCYEDFNKQLQEENLYDLYNKIEYPLIDVLFNMENNGFKLDKDKLYELSSKYQEEMKILVDEIITLAGEEFNVNSPKQLGDILFNKLGLPKVKKNLSTSVEVLEKLENYHPIISKILRYRKLSKLEGTYLQDFKKMLDKNNLIHTEFKQTLTSTGRLSSVEPNLQNLPIRDEEGKILRSLFVSRFDNGTIISADYSQIELRLLAHYSNDPRLVDAYHKGLDIHTKTASDIFGVDFNEVTSLQRRQAKAVNFGIIYGISEYGLSQNLNIKPYEAKEFINKYFETYPNVKNHMQNCVEQVKKTGYAITLFGRKRKIDEINSPHYVVRQFGERASMNMPLQGTASDLIKLAMINVYNAMKELNLKSKLVLQIHDELVIDTYPNEEKIVKDILKKYMENVVELNVPLIVDISSGKNLLEAN